MKELELIAQAQKEEVERLALTAWRNENVKRGNFFEKFKRKRKSQPNTKPKVEKPTA